MQLLTNVQSLQLPIFMVIGVTGFILCMVADSIKNRDLKAALEEAPEEAPEEIPFDDDGNQVKKPAKHKDLLFCLNMAGYICMLSSLICLYICGYFDKYIAMMFG